MRHVAWFVPLVAFGIAACESQIPDSGGSLQSFTRNQVPPLVLHHPPSVNLGGGAGPVPATSTRALMAAPEGASDGGPDTWPGDAAGGPGGGKPKMSTSTLRTGPIFRPDSYPYLGGE